MPADSSVPHRTEYGLSVAALVMLQGITGSYPNSRRTARTSRTTWLPTAALPDGAVRHGEPPGAVTPLIPARRSRSRRQPLRRSPRHRTKEAGVAIAAGLVHPLRTEPVRPPTTDRVPYRFGIDAGAERGCHGRDPIQTAPARRPDRTRP